MSSVKSIVIGVFGGSLLSLFLSVVLVDMLPFYISEYLPIFCGAVMALVLVGLAISVVTFLFSISSLIIVVLSTAGTFNMSYIKFNMLISWLLYVPVGIAGACSVKSIKSIKSKFRA